MILMGCQKLGGVLMLQYGKIAVLYPMTVILAAVALVSWEFSVLRGYLNAGKAKKD